MSWSGPWPTQEMATSRERLKGLKQLLDSLPSEPPEVGAELARFLVVRSTGYIEHTFETCIMHFAEAKSHPAVARHVSSGLFRGKNPRSDALLKRMAGFDDLWASDLGALLNDDDGRISRELDFMVDRRNRIAHGQSESVNRRKALDLAEVALEVGERLIELMDPR